MSAPLSALVGKTMKLRTKIGLGVLGLFVVAQLFQPKRQNPPVESDYIQQVQMPEALASSLRAACYDCHSHETQYPWYAYIVPVGNWIQGHVRHGREHLNFSTWATYSPEDQKELLHECAEEIEKGKMPLNSYTWLHGKAKLSAADSKALADWFNR